MVTHKSNKSTENNPQGSNETEGVWSSILSEVVSVDSSKLPNNKQLLLLGDAHAGKTTLVAKLQGNEDPKKGSGLEYTHILVRDEYRDATTRLSVWTLDGDAEHAHLLKFAVSERQPLADTVVVLTVAMTTPWLMMDQLQSWTTVIQDHIDQLNFSTDCIREEQARVQRRWQQYVEPGDDGENPSSVSAATSSVHPPTSASATAVLPHSSSTEHASDDVLLPLGETVLSRNMGLEMVVVVTKTDYMTTLEKDFDYKDEHFDFIQQYIRKFCLQYGAALFYTSVKEDKNCDLLYKYLTHRIYGFPFKTPALVVEKDAVFIPAGWDNDKKISILYEGMHSIHPETYYTEIIARPVIRKSAVKDAEVTADEEQQFLTKMQQSMTAVAAGLPVGSPAAAAAKQERGSVLASMQKTPERRLVSSPALSGSLSSGKKLEAGKPGAGVTSEGVLANFFNSLLNKKPGSVASSPGSSVSATGISTPPGNTSRSLEQSSDTSLVRSDAAAELERLSRPKKESTPESSDC